MEPGDQISIPVIHGGFQVYRAVPEETGEVMALLTEVAAWLHSRGSRQWEGILEGVDSHDTVNAIRRGDVFVFKQKAEIAGMVMLFRQPSLWDQQLWGEKASPQDQAVYLHRLAVRRSYAGQGLGQDILNWCSTGVQFPGKRTVRLDCVASVDTLNTFYANHGYTCVGHAEGYNIYEKPVREQP